MTTLDADLEAHLSAVLKEEADAINAELAAARRREKLRDAKKAAA